VQLAIVSLLATTVHTPPSWEIHLTSSTLPRPFWHQLEATVGSTESGAIVDKAV